MSGADDIRRCLVDMDVEGMRAAWKVAAPHLPQPEAEFDTLAAMHVARTLTNSVPLRLRAYSHRWLTERSLPSRLPDDLKPMAERLYPKIVASVGIAVKSKYPEIVTRVRGAMEYAVSDCYAMGDEDPAVVKSEMMQARRRELRGLGLTKRET